MKRITALLFVVSFTFSFAQDSLNCRLLSATGDLASVYCFDLKDNYAFIGHFNFSIVDISNIYNPVLVYSDTLADEINSIVVEGNIAYLATNEGLIILDVSSVESPAIISKLITDEYIEEVEIKNNVAYLGTMTHSFLVVDVLDPINPREIGMINTGDNVWNIEIADTLLFAASTDAGVKIYDIQSIDSLEEIGTLQLYSAADVKIKDNIAYAVQENIIHSFDITDPSNPVKLDDLLDGGGYTLNIEGNYTYSLGSGIRIVDISDPQNLRLAGYYITPKTGSDIYVKDRLIYAACQDEGIYFIQFDAPTSVEQNNYNPAGFSLSQNYPNPFNPSTKIKYTVSTPGVVQLKVFDLLGRELNTIVNTFQQPDSYEINFDGNELSSGIYYYRIITGDYTETRKMMLMK